MTNIDWRPDVQNGMGNSGFSNAVYYPGQQQDQQCSPMGGGFFGGVLGALMGAMGGEEGGGTCAAPEVQPLAPQPDVMWV
jgi:hypothetical protein